MGLIFWILNLKNQKNTTRLSKWTRESQAVSLAHSAVRRQVS